MLKKSKEKQNSDQAKFDEYCEAISKEFEKNNSAIEADLIKIIYGKRKKPTEESKKRTLRRVIEKINNSSNEFHIGKAISKVKPESKYNLRKYVRVNSPLGILKTSIEKQNYIKFDYTSKRINKRDYNHVAVINIHKSNEYLFAYRVEVKGNKHELSPDKIKRFYLNRITNIETNGGLPKNIIRLLDDLVRPAKITNSTDDFGYLIQKGTKYELHTLNIECTDYFIDYFKNEYKELYNELKKEKKIIPIENSKLFTNTITLRFVDIQRVAKFLFGNFKQIRIKNDDIKKQLLKYIEKEIDFLNSYTII